MKAEHRHQLHTNALADSLGRMVKGMKTAPKSTSLAIWLGIGALVVILVAWQVYRITASERVSTEWLKLDEATQAMLNTEGSYVRVVDDYPGSMASRSARFQIARGRIQAGEQNLTNFLMRNDAIKALMSAREIYALLASESSDTPILMEEALMAVAKVDESLIAVPNPDKTSEVCSTIDKAREAYLALAQKYPDSPNGKAAANRAQELEKNRAQWEKFYAQLNDLSTSPKPSFSGESTPPPKPNFPALDTQLNPAPSVPPALTPEPKAAIPTPKDTTKPVPTTPVPAPKTAPDGAGPKKK